MTLLHPDRVAAVWLRSGVPLLEANPDRATIKTHVISEGSLGVPIMCNPGTKEGVTVKEGRFAGVWPSNEAFFTAMRAKGALIGVAVDPLTAHECGNQRYLAIPWLDACLTARLPAKSGNPLKPMSKNKAWLAPLHTIEPEVIAPVGVGAQSLDGNPAVVMVAGAVGKLFVFAVRVMGVASVTVYSTYTRCPTKPDVTRKVVPLDCRVEPSDAFFQIQLSVTVG
jgi:hypothetical protein